MCTVGTDFSTKLACTMLATLFSPLCFYLCKRKFFFSLCTHNIFFFLSAIVLVFFFVNANSKCCVYFQVENNFMLAKGNDNKLCTQLTVHAGELNVYG